jgi:hypothetical protein
MPALCAVAHIRRLRGGSQSHLLRGSDGQPWVVKFQNNPQSVRVLANEMLATRLGHLLRLPMPAVEVIEVPDWLVTNTPELRMETGGSKTPCSAGQQLASRYVHGSDGLTFDYLPDAALSKVRNLQDLARCLVLDKWTCNSDGRQAVFTKSGRGFAATLIDQGYCFNAGEWNFPDSPLRGICPRPSAYENVTGWESFEPALSLAEGMPLETLRACADGIPEEWYGNDNDALDGLIETLYRRRSRIRSLIESFRKSTRNPFPHWGGSKQEFLPEGRSTLYSGSGAAMRTGP